MSKPIAIGVILFVLGIIVGRASVIASGPSTSAPASSVAMPSAMPFAQPAPTAGPALGGPRVLVVITLGQHCN